MVDLIIVRHGQTVENIHGICQGQTDGALSPLGLQQIQLVAKELSSWHFDAVISSPLVRAVQTAEAILQYHPKLKVEQDWRIAERYLGKLQGLKFPSGINFYEDIETAESIAELRLRANTFLRDLEKTRNGQTTLIVSHGVMISVILGVLNLTTDWAQKPKVVENTSITHLIYSDCQLIKYKLENYTGHLLGM
jgi:broad specificity phosphatase PhoE